MAEKKSEIETKEVRAAFHSSLLFKGMTEDQIDKIISIATPVKIDSGKVIIHQDDVSDDFYLITEGEVEILKEKGEGHHHRVAKLAAGDTIGELSMLDQNLRSATVRTIQETHLLRLTARDFNQVAKDSMIGTKTYRNLAESLSNRLRNTTEVTVAALERALEQSRQQIVIGNFMVAILIILTMFTFALGITSYLTHLVGTSGYITVGLLVVTTIVMVFLTIQSGYPMSFYGLTLKNWRASFAEGIIWSLPVLALATIAKWVVISQVPEFSTEPLFNFSGAVYSQTSASQTVIMLALLYVFASSPLQEFLFRGCFQGTLQSFLIGKYSNYLAILTTSLTFSMVHLMISPILAVFAFTGGIFWGALYRRHDTLVGVISSHILIGTWLFFILGVENMMVGKV